MTTIEDVRRALWAAYQKAFQQPDYMGKSSEGYCELLYPHMFEVQNEDEFLEPNGLMVYAYALGPSREHYFHKGPKDKQTEYWRWESPDFYAKVVQVINGWAANLDWRYGDDEDDD